MSRSSSPSSSSLSASSSHHSKEEEEKALRALNVRPGDIVRTAYRGGIREGHVVEIKQSEHGPKVVFERERPGQKSKVVEHYPSTLEKVPSASESAYNPHHHHSKEVDVFEHGLEHAHRHTHWPLAEGEAEKARGGDRSTSSADRSGGQLSSTPAQHPSTHKK